MNHYRKFSFVARFGIYLFLTLSAANCSIYEEKEDGLLMNNFTMTRPENDLSFFVISDWGYNGSENQLNLAEQMARQARLTNAQFVITCGDNFQVEGVESMDDPQWKMNFEDIYTDSALFIPWYPALGNHDYCGNVSAQVDYESVHGNWDMEAPYYTFVKSIDSTQIRFIILDTPDLIEKYEVLGDQSPDHIAQYQWFKNVLARSTEKWIIVVGHHPIISAGISHGNTPELEKLIKPLLQEYDVDFYLSGHDHHFEHSNEAPGETDYIVTGTGGTTRPIRYALQTLYAVSEIGFTQMAVTRDDIVLQFIDMYGRRKYLYRRSK